MRSNDREGRGGGRGAPVREIVGMRDMRSTHGGDRPRLSPCPTAPALSPTDLIHLHRCQASTAGKLGPQGRMGRIAGVRAGDAWHMVA